MSEKKILCINTSVEVAQQFDIIFHESSIGKKLGSKCGYTNTSTWLKIAVLNLIKSDPSAERLSKLHESCKTDADLLTALQKEIEI